MLTGDFVVFGKRFQQEIGVDSSAHYEERISSSICFFIAF